MNNTLDKIEMKTRKDLADAQIKKNKEATIESSRLESEEKEYFAKLQDDFATTLAAHIFCEARNGYKGFLFSNCVSSNNLAYSCLILLGFNVSISNKLYNTNFVNDVSGGNYL